VQTSKVYPWQGKWNSQGFYQFLCESSAAAVSLVPTQLFDLVELGLQAPARLRIVFMGGASLEQSLCDQAKRLGWPLVSSYGMTEASSMVGVNDLRREASPEKALPLDLHTALPSDIHKALPLGTYEPLPHWQISADAESSVLQLRGPSLFRMKVKVNADQSLSVESVPKDSWWSTSDRVEIFRDSFRWLGRADDFIKIKGEGLVLSQVLSRLRSDCDQRGGQLGLSAQQIAGLIPIEDSRRGFRLMVLVETLPPSKDWTAFLRNYNSEVPSHEAVHGYLALENWPRSELGKLRLQEAKEYLLAQKASWILLDH
jgi:O-succinylbenzoic acid--CoA ligase